MPAGAIPDVIGIACRCRGVNANYGTMTKPLHAGQAARNGIMAALLGAAASRECRGARGPRRIRSTFARGLEWSLEPFQDIGRRFDLAEHGFRLKRYPCGGVIHTGIDAALELREELGPRIADITAIKAGITKYAAAAPASSIRETSRRRNSICNMSSRMRWELARRS